jgi:putative salt-induced outer membrane protein YdiY
MTRTFRIALVLAATVLIAFRPAWADEVRLKNGDRITGKVVSLQRGILKFDTGHGSLDLPWDDIVAATIDTPLILTAAGRPPETVRTMTVGEGQVAIGPGVAIMANQVTALARPAAPPMFTGGANVGLISTGGNTDVNSLRLDGDLVVRAARNRYTSAVIVNRSVDHDVETARNGTLNVRYDRFLTTHMYANGTALFTHDRFRDIDLRSALGAGLGFQAVETPRMRFGAEGGYGYVQERFRVAAKQSYHAVRENATLDVFAFGRRMTFFHRHDGFFGLTDTNNLFVQTRVGVRGSLMGGLAATLQFDVDYDRSPSPGRKRIDRSVGLTFGYRF